MAGIESAVVESANLPEDVLPRTEDPENKFLLNERIRLLPGFPSQYQYVVMIY